MLIFLKKHHTINNFSFYRSCCDHLQAFLISLCILSFLPVPLFADDKSSSPLVIRVGAYENQPKIFTDETGEIVGLFPDVLNSIARKEGWALKYVPGTWSQCLKRLEANQIDLMVDVAFSEKRARKYYFSNETFLVNWATVYTDQKQSIESLVDLRGKKIAVMRGSIHTEGEGGIKKLALEFDIECSFIEVDNYKEVFELLHKGEADAGIVNRIFGALFADDYDLRKTSIIFNPRHLKFAFPKDSAIAHVLAKKIDANLRRLKGNPDSIYNRAVYVYLSGLPREMLFAKSEMTKPEKRILLTTAEKAWIREHPVIRLGVDPEFAPFEYVSSDGTYSGITSDYIKILNQRLGLDMQVAKGLTWEESVAWAKTRKIDVLPCVAPTQERKQFFKFSVPYINFHRVIITRTDTPFLSGLNDITDMRVAVQRDTSHEGYLRDHTYIEPHLFKTQQDALLAVSNGQVQAFIGNIASSTYWIRKLNLTNLKVAAPVSQETQNLHFAVRSDWPVLVRILNKGLASISPEEENDIRRRWVNIEYKPGIAPRLVWRYLLQIAGVALIILLITLWWNFRLKKEIEKRTEIDKKLFEANQNLKKLDQLKSMFIASMSHELRTPLNSIIGFTGVIVQGMTGPLNAKQQDHLTRVYNSAKHLLALITDVIDISKIEAGRIDVFTEDIILSEVISEAVINIDPQLKAKNLEIDISVPADLQMRTDRKRLLQCLINYLSNAVKYTETGRIGVKARTCEENVEILVSDTGIGIPPEDQIRLFEAFERLDSHLRVKAGGTGLGLYLTRKLATEILGGETLFNSQKDRGSTFGLLIPMNLEATGNRPQPVDEASP